MRIGLFGGSFDPVHRGHLLLAECCWRQAKLDRVDFMPTARQPLKPRGPAASETDRVEMLRLAIAGRPQLEISLVEIERGGVSYTVDTLRRLVQEEPAAEYFFLMGADSLAELPAWREPTEICRLATPLVVRRAGAEAPDFAALARLVTAEQLAAIRALEVEMPATPISSSEIRRLIVEGGEWRSLVPPGVAEYIEAHGIYWTSGTSNRHSSRPGSAELPENRQ